MRTVILTSKILIILLLLGLSTLCCTDNNEPLLPPDNKAVIEGEVSIKDALGTLSSFLQSVKKTRSITSSKNIETIETFCKGATPVAYLVNYADRQGYSVLGANNQVEPIIAAVDSGEISWDIIMNSDDKNNNSSTIERLVGYFIKNGIEGGRGDIDWEDEQDPGENNGGGSGGGAGFLSSAVDPMTMNLTFNQQRTYCHLLNGHYVISGCPATALSIITAYNEFPFVVADGDTLDYAHINTFDGLALQYRFYKADHYSCRIYLPITEYFYDVDSMSVVAMEEDERWDLLATIAGSGILSGHDDMVSFASFYPFYKTQYKLIASMYQTVDNIVSGWEATGALPISVKNALEALGYTNVDYWTKDNIDYEQQCRIATMLNHGKPLIMGGWSLWHPGNSHYWVVDGSNISAASSLIHCNWGHGGNNNGWFATSCIRKRHAVQYDDPDYHDEPVADSTSEYNHLIVYHYDIPDTTIFNDVSVCAQLKTHFYEN